MDKGFTVVLEHMGLALGMGMVLDTMDRILAVALRLGKHSEDFSDTLQLVPSSSFTLEQSTVQYAYMRCTHYTSEHHVHDSRSSIRPLTSICICNDARAVDGNLAALGRCFDFSHIDLGPNQLRV